MSKQLTFLFCCFALPIATGARTFAQTTVPFETAQQYADNFNETLDASAAGGSPGTYLNWYSPGLVRLASTGGTFGPQTAGAALYNPSAATTTAGPVFSNGTVATDITNSILMASFQTTGVLARAQADGHSVFASFSPRFGQPTAVSISYGTFNTVTPTVDGTIYSTNVAFTPTRMTLSQQQNNGVPEFLFQLSDGNGNGLYSGWIPLTQTGAYNAAGEVGFRMTTQANGFPGVDNFFVTPTVTLDVPEPATLSLAAVGLLAGCGIGLRRRKA